jgi:hypothetical protein
VFLVGHVQSLVHAVIEKRIILDVLFKRESMQQVTNPMIWTIFFSESGVLASANGHQLRKYGFSLFKHLYASVFSGPSVHFESFVRSF